MKGRGFAAGCVKRFLRLMRPMGTRVLKFDNAVGAEGCGIGAFGVDEYIAASRQQRCGIVFPPSQSF